jgi:hypothetical protein
MAEAEVAAAESVAPPPDPRLLETLPDGTKVKSRKPRQRACNEPDGKKICAGHLKRWYEPGEEVRRRLGADAEIYRCERCHTLYLPNPEETPRTRTLAF